MVQRLYGQGKEEDHPRVNCDHIIEETKDEQFSWMEGLENCVQKVKLIEINRWF